MNPLFLQNSTHDVYWSYETREKCFKRGKDATFYIPKLKRFYYMSISKDEQGQYHLAFFWLPISEEASKEMNCYTEVTLPLEGKQSVNYTLKAPRMDSSLSMDENVRALIRDGDTLHLPMKKWR